MAAPINIDVYSDALVVLGTAGIVVPMVRRFGLSPVLGYLAAGAMLGPLGLGSLIKQFPFLYWLTVVDAKNVAGIAELGVVFLLFIIGMELSFERLKTMRRLVFGLGSLQIILSAAVIGGIASLFGNPPTVSVILGACLALSSTAIVIEVLSNHGRLATTAGRTSFAVLLAQDLAVIPMLLLVSIMGSRSGGSVMTHLGLALVNATLAVAAIVIVGRLLLRPLFRLVASTGSHELFVAAALFVIIGAGVAAAAAGLSMALGAFIAGLLLAETEFRKAIETTIGPFKGLLLGVFFFTVGMNIDIRELARRALAASGVRRRPHRHQVDPADRPCPDLPPVLVGGDRNRPAARPRRRVRVRRHRPRDLARAHWLRCIELHLDGDIDHHGADSGAVAGRAAAGAEVPRAQGARPGTRRCASWRQRTCHRHRPWPGRTGRLHACWIGTAVPISPSTMTPPPCPEQRRSGREVYYGDATLPEFLKTCGVMDAKAVIVTVAAADAIDEVVRQVRALRSDIVIVSRARDAAHARHLYAIGVTDAVPETIEASLQLSEAALIGLGQADRAGHRLDPRAARRIPARTAAGGRADQDEPSNAVKRKTLRRP